MGPMLFIVDGLLIFGLVYLCCSKNKRDYGDEENINYLTFEEEV